MMLEQTAEYQQGRKTESAVVNFLRSRHAAILPAYGMLNVDPTTKAPVMLLPDGGRLVVPDLMVFCPEHQVCWVEVKSKTNPGYFRIHEAYTHAIDFSLFLEYRKVERLTGIPVWIVVHELNSGEILAVKLADVARLGSLNRNWPHEDGEGSRERAGGWWWRRESMVVL